VLLSKNFYGFTIKTLSEDCMFAHKLCAVTDRKKMQNRDIYDSLFMFERGFDINEDIIEIRTGKSLKEYLVYLFDFINKNIKPNLILDGLGEVLDNKRKNWVKNNLISRLLFEINIRTK
jgi:hypothetical protein